MKKIVIVLVVLFVLAAAGIAVFFATFDANKYKGLIESKAGEALGSQVKIGELDLRFRGGLALGIEKLGVYEKGAATPALSVETAEVSLQLLPLLKKSIEVSSIRLDRPRITVVRDAQAVRVLGVNPPQTAKGTAAGSKQGSGMPAMTFLVGEIKITEGEVTYRDTVVAPPSEITAKHLNVLVKNVSLAGPVQFDAEAAVLGEKTNVRASGKALNLIGGAPQLRDALVSVDLNLLDFDALLEAVPAVRTAGLRRELAGKVEVRADQLILGPKGPEKFNVRIKITDGRAGVETIKPLFENIRLDAVVDEKTARVNDLSLQFSGGIIEAKGSSQGYMTQPQSEADLSVQGVRIDPFVPLTSDGKPLVEGAVSIAFKGSANGAAWPQISQSLNGNATLGLEKGILLNLNIIRELLGKLSMFPGLVETLEKSLPESYRPKLTRQSTILNPVEHAFVIQNGTVLIRDFNVSTDFFSARLDADARLSGSLDGKGSVQMDKTFSKAMLDGFPQTEFLANSVSQIELPLLIKYGSGKLSVLPDLKQIMKNLTAGQAQAAVSGLLGGTGSEGGKGTLAGLLGETKTGTVAATAPTAGAPSSGAEQPATSAEDKVMGWLNKITDASKSTNEPAPAAGSSAN